MSRSRLWRRGRDQVAAWLPALMMMLFALGTWWLVRSIPSLDPLGLQTAAGHEPDYRMSGFFVRNFDADGRLVSELRGDQGRHYPDTDTLEVDQPRVRSHDSQGHPSMGRAEHGVSNGEGTDIHLYGHARIVREAIETPQGEQRPRLEFRGPYLHAERARERLSSDQPVELLRGVDRFTGDTFEYDHQTGVAQLHGQVRGVIQPPAVRSQASP